METGSSKPQDPWSRGHVPGWPDHPGGPREGARARLVLEDPLRVGRLLAGGAAASVTPWFLAGGVALSATALRSTRDGVGFGDALGHVGPVLLVGLAIGTVLGAGLGKAITGRWSWSVLTAALSLLAPLAALLLMASFGGLFLPVVLGVPLVPLWRASAERSQRVAAAMRAQGW